MTVTNILVRDIDGPPDLRAVEEIQKAVWGLPDLDVVPLTQLVAAQASGGVVIGASDGDILAGFAYGFAGYEEGHVTHHSHMLAVRPEYRSSNVGYQLKLAQRERVLALGIDRMTWTFDPLQSVNANLNFDKLGVVSDRYFVNFYGEDAASFLHRNGTDRLWVTWLLDSRHVRERLSGEATEVDLGNISSLVEVGNDQMPRQRTLDDRSPDEQAVIEIPSDINDLGRENGEIAVQWREATRTAFTEAIAAGYLVYGFHRGVRDGQRIGRYLLKRGESLGDIA